jgi:hypothetical protein
MDANEREFTEPWLRVRAQKRASRVTNDERTAAENEFAFIRVLP